MINLNISGNLRRLRKQREITQEDLADFIGVSFQAVSKWERGEGYPDITILPAIANFFDVTLDELVGMNEIKDAKKLEEIKAQSMKLHFDGKNEERINLLREALKIFPNNYELLADLASVLSFHETWEKEASKKRNEEAVKISERILDFCTDTKIRNDVQANICKSLHIIGEQERAVELAKKLPDVNRSSNVVLGWILDGKDLVEHTQKSIGSLLHILHTQIRWHLADVTSVNQKAKYYTPEEAINLCQKVIDIINIIYEEGDFDFKRVLLHDTYYEITSCHLKLGNTEEAIKNLEKSAEHAIAYETRPDTLRGKSLLSNMLTFEKTKSSSGTEKNVPARLKELLESVHDFKIILDDERVQKILAELSKNAN